MKADQIEAQKLDYIERVLKFAEVFTKVEIKVFRMKSI
jgi:hypothetical protein